MIIDPARSDGGRVTRTSFRGKTRGRGEKSEERRRDDGESHPWAGGVSPGKTNAIKARKSLRELRVETR